MKTLLLSILISACTALQASTYEMEGGSLRRENRSLSPIGIQGPASVLWKQPLAGLGLGAPLQHPLILSDRIIQPFGGGLGCVDRQSGAVLWRKGTGNIYNTPTFDPQRNLIYVSDRNGNMAAHRPADGSMAWSRGSGSSASLDMASVTLHGQHIYIGNSNGSLLCLNADTRAVVWSTLLMAGKGITTPAIDGGSIYVASAGKRIFRLNLSSGAIEWQKSFSSLSAPVSAITLGPDKGYFLTAESKVFAFDRGSGNLLWSYLTGSWGYSNLSLYGDILLEATDDRHLRALNAHTGALIWDTPLAGNFGRCAPIIICGVVYIAGCAYEFYSLDLRTGTLLSTFRTEVANSFVDWAEADGEVYVTDATGATYRFQTTLQSHLADCDPGHVLSTPTPLATPQPVPGPCQVPANPDLTLWLAASQGVQADAQGLVTRWDDQSGYGHHALATGSMRPKLVPGAWGGRPVLRFDGIANFMSLFASAEGGLSGDNAGITVIAALKFGSSNSTNSVLLSNAHGQPGAVALARWAGAWHFTPAFNGGTPDITSYRVMSFRLNGSTPSVRRDGLPVAPTSSTPYLRDGKLGWTLGRQGHTDHAPFKGDLYAMLVFRRALSDAEITAYEQCLLLTPHTPTATPSATKTWTATGTATPTASETATPTASPSASPTKTATPSATDTATESATPSFTPSFTETATPTESPSSTPSATSTPSSTPSFSHTPADTFTATPTETVTLTPTETFTTIPTELPSPKPSPAPSPDPTPAPTPAPPPKPTKDRGCDGPLIDRVMITPNPSNAAADRMVSVKLGCGADEVRIEIYSVAGVRLFEWVDTSKHVERGQWVHEKYPHEVDLANGTYFVRIYVTYEGRTETALTTFVVLK